MSKRLIALILALTCLVSLPAPALCAGPGEAESVHAELYKTRIYFKDGTLDFWTDEGYGARVLCYSGTAYIPLCTAATWMAADGAWDREHMTVTLIHNGGEPAFLTRYVQKKPDPEGANGWNSEGGVTAELRRDLTVTVDGQAETFVNIQGEPVYPLVFRDNVYLPVRSVARLCGLDTVWFQYSYPGGSFLLDNITLLPPMTDEGLAEERRYLDQFYAYGDQVQTRLEALAAMKDPDPETRSAAVKELYQFLFHIYGQSNNCEHPSIYFVQGCFRETLTGPLYYTVDYDATCDPPGWDPELRWDDILGSVAEGLESLRESLALSEIGYAALAAQVAARTGRG